MRTSCTECAIKHLSTALALIMEVQNGYPDHRLIAIGELVQAEHELLDDFPEMANRVRAERLLWRGSLNAPKEYNIPFLELMRECQRLGKGMGVVDVDLKPKIKAYAEKVEKGLVSKMLEEYAKDKVFVTGLSVPTPAEQPVLDDSGYSYASDEPTAQLVEAMRAETDKQIDEGLVIATPAQHAETRKDTKPSWWSRLINWFNKE